MLRNAHVNATPIPKLSTKQQAEQQPKQQPKNRLNNSFLIKS